MRRYARELDEIWKEQFSRVLSHDLYWENKTYELKRSILIKTNNVFLIKNVL